MFKQISIGALYEELTPREQQRFFMDLDAASIGGRKPVEKYLDFIHYIWVGESFAKRLRTFGPNLEAARRHFPDQEILLWTDHETLKDKRMLKWASHHGIRLIPVTAVFTTRSPMFNQDIFDHEDHIVETNRAKQADVLRYEIEFRFGGVYFDVDEHYSSLLNLGEKNELGALNLFDPAREFGFCNDVMSGRKALFPDAVGSDLMCFGSNNCVLTANRPGIEFYRHILCEIRRRACLSYPELKALTTTRTKIAAGRSGRTFEFRYQYWHTMQVTGPTMMSGVAKQQDGIPSSWRIPRKEAETAKTWIGTINTKLSGWFPETDSESDDMVSRVIQSSLDRLKRYRFDMTRYDFLLKRCRSTAQYPDPHQAILEIVKAHLRHHPGQIPIKFVFARTVAEEAEIWAVVRETENLGNPKPERPTDPPHLLTKLTVFKALKRAISQANVPMIAHLIQQWEYNMWLIRRERQEKETLPKFTRAYRLLNAAQKTERQDIFIQVSEFIVSFLQIEGIMSLDPSDTHSPIAKSIIKGITGFAADHPDGFHRVHC